MRTYSDAEAAGAKFTAWARRYRSQTAKERFAEDFDPFAAVETGKAYGVIIRALASALLLALDGLLSDLRTRTRNGDDRCTDDGPELAHGVTVDRALDAVGNYVRHAHEWRLHDYRQTWPNKRQLRSIIALARLSTTMPIKDNDAEEAYKTYTETNPPLMVLDLLCDYEQNGPSASYENVERKILEAGVCIIRASFSTSRPG
jgi:hypothetical protein